jgi:hypothetical protein
MTAPDDAPNGQVIISDQVPVMATSTAVTSSPNPSAAGQSVTFTATVTVSPPGAGTPTGTVTFKYSRTTLGTATLTSNGTATLPASSLTAGGQTITAVYAGDSDFTGSTSAAVTQVVTNRALAPGA